MIQEKILELTEYGLVTGLAAPEDKRFTINRLLELFQLMTPVLHHHDALLPH